MRHARYLLRPAALELFLRDRSNALFSFPSPQASGWRTPPLFFSCTQCFPPSLSTRVSGDSSASGEHRDSTVALGPIDSGTAAAVNGSGRTGRL